MRAEYIIIGLILIVTALGFAALPEQTLVGNVAQDNMGLYGPLIDPNTGIRFFTVDDMGTYLRVKVEQEENVFPMIPTGAAVSEILLE